MAQNEYKTGNVSNGMVFHSGIVRPMKRLMT